SIAAHVIRLTATAAIAMSIASCAAMKIGYNNADTLALLQLDSYLGLTADQEQLVKERMNALLAWHRSTQLRDYAAFIDKMRSKVSSQVTAADVMEFNQQLNARMMTAGDKAAPDIAQVALTLTPDQIDRAAKKVTNDATKARREFVRAEKDAGAERVKKYGERAESWFGKLTAEQKDIIRKSLASRPTHETWWIDERERRQREFISLLRKIQADRPTEEVAARWFRTYFMQLNVAPDADRRARAESYRRGSAELIAQLINHATPEQRAALDKKLNDYAQDFRSLAASNG
ncbi:MAG TPA: DUF6279 family lipoprotein, partial [Burkholderiaceae bacterium]|nr:DUF6279 family lipoprotein [Burkholderiaceae bacterium]